MRNVLSGVLMGLGEYEVVSKVPSWRMEILFAGNKRPENN